VESAATKEMSNRNENLASRLALCLRITPDQIKKKTAVCFSFSDNLSA
jgi:hypothetical protein